jgi:hypothetical protein
MSRAATQRVSPPLLVALGAAVLMALFMTVRPMLDAGVPEDPGVSFDGPALATATPDAVIEFTIPAEPRNPFRVSGTDTVTDPVLSLDLGTADGVDDGTAPTDGTPAADG